MRIPKRLTSPVGITALVGVALLAFLALAGQSLWGVSAEATSVADRLAGPSAAHPFGTDALGRDILARVLVGARLSILLTLGATVISVVGGVVLGLIPAISVRPVRRLITGFIDLLLAFPWLLLALFFSAIWGASAVGAMLAIGLAGAPTFARLSYTLASSVMGRDYVRAARIVGVGPLGILGRHVLPNTFAPLLVNAAVQASTTLLSFAALSFLGLGVQSPEYDWGRLLREGITRIYVNPFAAIGPGIAIVLTGIILSLSSELFTDQARSRPVSLPARAAKRVIEAATRAVKPTRIGGAGDPALVVDAAELRVSFPDQNGGMVERVHGIDFTIEPGEIVGIVGESGSGKSVTSMAIAGLIEHPGKVDAGRLLFDDIDMGEGLTKAHSDRLGVEMAMIFQDPLTSLNPALTIGRQLTEVTEVHQKMSRAESNKRAVAALESVGITDAERRLGQYPHQFSGGMRQRAMIGMALMGSPRLIIADEPTTALDMTVQRQVVKVLRDAQRLTGAAILFISHDIALVSGICDRVVVMKDGLVVEVVDARHLERDAKHPYTKALIACVPHMATDRTRPLPVIGHLDPIAETSPAS